MKTYWDVALDDYSGACANVEINQYRVAVYLFQQFAEKGAKYLLECRDPKHEKLRSHKIEEILSAYDNSIKAEEMHVWAVYLSSFYFNTRYPGDNYADIEEPQVARARKYADEFMAYYEQEIGKMKNIDISGTCSSLRPAATL